MVANRAETLGGDEASRFRTIPLSLEVTRRVSPRKKKKKKGIFVLFRVGVGYERVNHEIAVKQNVRTGLDRV